MVNEHSRLPNGALVKVLTKPLCHLSNSFFAATARREIHGHGDRLHCTELPPTLQGFFYGNGYQDVDLMLPPQEFGLFANIVGRTSAVSAMDASFVFLSEVVEENEHIFLLDSCNGLVLFGLLRDAYYPTQELGYIVCNPVTEQWMRVPSCTWIDDNQGIIITSKERTSLLFDPAVSSHFQLVLFRDHDVIDARMTRTTTHSYKSETRHWSHSVANWIEERQEGSLERWRVRQISQNPILSGFPTAFVNGMIYLILEGKLVLKVDPQGKTRCIIPAPPVVHIGADNTYVIFLGQSQGLLHCIMEEGYVEDVPPEVPSCCHSRWKSCGLSVWVLEDSNTPKWALKRKMSIMELFGKNCEAMVDYHVVTVHQDCNVIFFIQHQEAQMVSYDMDHQKACALQSFKNEYGPITLTPYTPYLSELFVGVTGAHK